MSNIIKFADLQASEKVETKEVKKRQRKLPKTITESQALEILNGINKETISGCRHYAVIMTMYRAGLRVSEICNLTLADMNYEKGLIFVQDGKGQKDRYVPMDAEIVAATKAWLEVRPETKEQWFFCAYSKNKVGKKLSTDNVKNMCYRTSDNANVYIQNGAESKKVSPHKLRHSALTNLLNEGFNLRQVQEIAGHEDISTTQIYTHIAIDDLAEKFKQRPLLGMK